MERLLPPQIRIYGWCLSAATVALYRLNLAPGPVLLVYFAFVLMWWVVSDAAVSAKTGQWQRSRRPDQVDLVGLGIFAIVAGAAHVAAEVMA